MIDLLKVLFERKLNKGPSRKSFCTKPSYCSLHQCCSIFNFFFGQLKLEQGSIVVPSMYFTQNLISIDLENCGINFLDFAAKINSKTLSQKNSTKMKPWQPSYVRVYFRIAVLRLYLFSSSLWKLLQSRYHSRLVNFPFQVFSKKGLYLMSLQW